MTIALDSLSRFKTSEPIITPNGISTFGRWARPSFMYPENLPDSSVLRIAVNQSNAGRPDVIANELYGSPLLEWVVVMFNRPLNTVGWPKAGSIIKVPSRDILFSNI